MMGHDGAKKMWKEIILSPYLINNICKVENVRPSGGGRRFEEEGENTSAMFESSMDGQFFEKIFIIILSLLTIFEKM